MKRHLPWIALALSLAAFGCEKDRPVVVERTQINPRMHTKATAMTPEVNIEQRDGGATHIQINGVQVNLPGERATGDRRQAEAENEQN